MRDFDRLWAGQTVSLFGSAVSRLAIPTTAIFALHATAFAVGALQATTFVAFPILGVFAGVWIDRWERRRVMIFADIVRALALASVPIAAFAHVLTLVQLFAVALVTSIASVFFDIAYQAYLPDIVMGEALMGANSRLEISSSAAQIGGNGLAGLAIARVGAAMTVAFDAASFVVSFLALANIRTKTVRAASRVEDRNFARQLREGLATVFANRALRRVVACTATSNLGASMVGAVYLVFAYRTLHLSPAIVGLVLALGNAGFIGAFLAPRIVARFGLPATIRWSIFVAGVSQAFLPLATLGLAIPSLIAEGVIQSAFVPIYNIAQVSWRQSTVPLALQGRMNATVRTIVMGTLPLGAFLGGTLATLVGIVPTLVIATVIEVLAVIWLFDESIHAIRATELAPSL